MWDRLAGLALEVDGYTLERLESPPVRDVVRVTTMMRISGGGLEGVGEDITGPAEEHDALHAAGPYLELAGSWTLEAFLDHLATLDQWKPRPPPWEAAPR